jgi:outer membrane immunogenic protein
MRKFFLAASAALATLVMAAPASAADIPVKARPLPPPPVFSWTGFYIGVHVGAGFGTKEWEQFFSEGTEVGNTFSSHTVNGILGGGQIGFNYQVGWAVWGVEFQASAADLRGKGSCGLVAEFNCNTKVTGLATFAGRFGVTSDRLLFYVKGGAAWARDKYDVSFFVNEPEIVPSSISDNRWGWMIGTGIEYAFAPNWSAKVEYNYMDFGTKGYVFNLTPTEPGLFDRFDITQRIHLVKFGLNYRFDLGKAPVYAKY